MLNYKWIGAIMGACALILRIIASWFPEGTEAIYSRKVFPVIRQLIDNSISRLPFPTVYLFAAAVVGVVVFILVQVRKKEGRESRRRYLFLAALNFIGFLVFSFLVLWGYNYQRVPVYQQLSLEPVPLNQEQLLEEILLTHSALVEARALITSDTLPIEEAVPYSNLEQKVREEVRRRLSMLGFDSKGHPRTKEFYPPGFLRRMGILGIYFPFTGESYIDGALHPLEKPFTVAHEMAHSFGITDEGEANFISWIVGIGSGDPLLQYSAQLQLFRYQINDLYRMDKLSYRDFIVGVAPGIRNDIIAILLKGQEVTPLSPALTRFSNDLFLKTQGVNAGVKSYAQLPMLVHAWRK